MNFIVALVLLFMEEEDAFWMLVVIEEEMYVDLPIVLRNFYPVILNLV